MATFQEGDLVRAGELKGLPYGLVEEAWGWRYEGAKGVVGGNVIEVDGYEPGQIVRVIYHGDGTHPNSFGTYMMDELEPREDIPS